MYEAHGSVSGRPSQDQSNQVSLPVHIHFVLLVHHVTYKFHMQQQETTTAALAQTPELCIQEPCPHHLNNLSPPCNSLHIVADNKLSPLPKAKLEPVLRHQGCNYWLNCWLKLPCIMAAVLICLCRPGTEAFPTTHTAAAMTSRGRLRLQLAPFSPKTVTHQVSNTHHSILSSCTAGHPLRQHYTRVTA